MFERMKLEDVLGSYRKGSPIRRASWAPGQVLGRSEQTSLTYEDMVAEDWEVSNLRFYEAVNAMLLEGRPIYRTSGNDPLKSSVTYVDGELWKGLCTSSVRKYAFTEEDAMAGDWATGSR